MGGGLEQEIQKIVTRASQGEEEEKWIVSKNEVREEN